MKNLIAFDTKGIELTVEEIIKLEDAENKMSDLMRRFRKFLNRHSRNMSYNNDAADCLLLYLDFYPQIFAMEYGEISRDAIKWALAENIKANRRLIDKIQEVEKNLNLEIHQIW